jgi:hypothetical protein
MEAKALNLVTRKTTPDTRTPRQRDALAQVYDYGNNGWVSGSFGRTQAKRVIQHYLQGISPDIILGYMLAHGRNAKAVDRLAKLL